MIDGYRTCYSVHEAPYDAVVHRVEHGHKYKHSTRYEASCGRQWWRNEIVLQVGNWPISCLDCLAAEGS